MTRTLADTWTLAKRGLRHITRSPDTVITVLLIPIALMLLFVYVWGGALGQQTGSVSYINFIVPGIVVMTVISGISYAAYVSTSTCRVASSIASGRCRSRRRRSWAGRLRRPLVQPLLISCGLLGRVRDRFPATGWSDGMAGLCRNPAVVHALDDMARPSSSACLPRRRRGPVHSAIVLLLLIFISPAFVPTNSMTPLLRGLPSISHDSSG